MRLVAVDAGFSLSAGARHVRNCLQPAQRQAMRRNAAATLHLADFGTRMLGLADAAGQIRDEALESRNYRLALLSSREEREALTILLGRLGIDDGETVELLREARALVSAVNAVLADQPVIAARMASYLADQGDTDLAQAFRSLANMASARQVEAAAAQNRFPRKGIAV